MVSEISLGGQEDRKTREETAQVLSPCPPSISQVSVINGTSPFAQDYDLTHIIAAYQERNGEYPDFIQMPLRVFPG